MSAKDRNDAAELRRQAEDKAATSPGTTGLLPDKVDSPTLHELRVHQIELEMQNEELRRTQQELHAERTRYIDLYDQAPVGYVTVGEKGLILTANLTVAALLGVARGLLVKQPAAKFIFKDDADSYHLFLRRLITTGEPQTSEVRMVKSDGTLFWAHLVASVPGDAGGAPVSRITLSDITERKQAEKALRESETYIRAVMDSIPVGISVHSVEDAVKFSYMNDNFCRFYRTTREALSFPDAFWNAVYEDPVFREDLKKRVLSDCASCDPNRRHWDDIPVTRKGAETRYISAMNTAVPGKPLMISAVWDVTERKREQEYKELGLSILHLLNEKGSPHEAVRCLIGVLKERTGLDAVGLRLQDGADFPYFAAAGFPEDFLLTENTLAERGADGGVCRDGNGKACLECTCGLVISGKTDPTHPLFTRGGSFWTNNAGSLLDLPTDQDPRHHPRNQCILHGYASMALIPVRNKECIIGLLHLNDRRNGCFTLAKIEIMEDIATHIGEALMRKRADEALEKSEREFRSLAESMPQIVWVTRADGCNIYFNQQWVEYTGLTLEESCGHGWATPFHPDDRERALGAWKNATESDAPYSLECRLRRADGAYRWWLVRGVPLRDPDGTILKWIGTCTDIEDIKRSEEALRKSEERLDLALRSAHMGVWQWDIVADKRTFDDQTCSLLGLDPSTFHGTSADFFAAVHPDDREKVAEALAQAITQDVPYAPEYRAVWPDGSVRHLGAGGQVVRDTAGRPLAISGIIWDITAHKRAEEELQKIDKLQSIGTLAGGIAHDFNNILLGLFGNISIAMDDLSKEHPSYAPLAEAEKSMSRAVRLTKQLLTFSKGGEPVKENVSLGAMVEEVARFDLSGSNVSLVYHLAEELWPVDADKGQIQQVVSNLVINARQAMPDGGHLTVTLENADLPAEAVPALRQGRYVKVTVHDEGHGIEPKVIGKIFDPYFTTKQTGSGLGLATVWSIITRHSGHIDVVSQIGKGTAFTFYLPASAASPQAEDLPPAAERPSPTRPVKILVMDDEEMVCSLAELMLVRGGYTVATAPGGQEAVALYKQALEAGAPFDVVIMDLTIPGGPGGKEVLKDLLALDPHIRALVSSGYAEDPVMANPSAFGFKGTVAKPYTANTLRLAVARVLM